MKENRLRTTYAHVQIRRHGFNKSAVLGDEPKAKGEYKEREGRASQPLLRTPPRSIEEGLKPLEPGGFAPERTGSTAIKFGETGAEEGLSVDLERYLKLRHAQAEASRPNRARHRRRAGPAGA